MVKYELIYFDGAGRAETARLMLHLAGVEFEDKRFGFAEWPNIKASTPLGAVPVLKVDEVEYCQSVVSLLVASAWLGGPACLLQSSLSNVSPSCHHAITCRTPRFTQFTTGNGSICSKASRILPR